MLIKASALPLIIGVTGHRDLVSSNHKLLQDQVEAALHKIRKLYPNSPLVMLSALAEGADRLAVRAALKFKMRIVAPLPLPRDLYEEDFPGTKDEFAELLRGSDSFEVPLSGGATRADVARPGAARDAQYARSGAFIVRHCHILIALWDGTDNQKPGGTAQVAGWKLKGLPRNTHPTPSMLNPSEAGLVVHIVTPRDNGQTTTDAYATRWLAPRAWDVEDTAPQDHRPLDAGAAPYYKVLALINEFNRAAAKLTRKGLAAAERSKEDLLPHDAAALVPELKAVREGYGLADALAVINQRQTLYTLRGLHLLTFFAALGFELFAEFFAHEQGWGYVGVLAGFPILLSAAFICHHIANRHNWETNYLDYRALAEGFRIQFYWQYAGIREPVYDHYLGLQRNELRWIPEAIRALDFESHLPHIQVPAPPLPEERIISASTRWVQPQAAYFARKKHVNKHLSHKSEKAATLIFSASILCAFVYLPYRIWYAEAAERIEHAVLFGLSMLLVVAALLHNYAHMMAYSAHAKQYGWMGGIFRNALTRLKNYGVSQPAASGPATHVDCAAAREVLTELGKEALAENGEWLLVHRERPIEVPHP